MNKTKGQLFLDRIPSEIVQSDRHAFRNRNVDMRDFYVYENHNLPKMKKRKMNANSTDKLWPKK